MANEVLQNLSLFTGTVKMHKTQLILNSRIFAIEIFLQ